MVSEPVSKKFGTEKSLGTGLEKIWYRKKSRNRSRKNLVPKKVPEPVLKKFSAEKSLTTDIKKIYMGQIPQDGENEQYVALFF